jgi:hypothetical protein
MSSLHRGREYKKTPGNEMQDEFRTWLKKYLEIQFRANGEWKRSGKGIIPLININSIMSPDSEVTEYLEEVILEYPTSIPFKDIYSAGCCAGASYLVNHVPVFLVEEKAFVQYNDNAPSDTFEYLGRYTRMGNEKEIPSIFICFDRIAEITEKVNQKYLFAAVAIHAFAHALMDCGIDSLRARTQTHSPIYEWVEESLANLITLQITRKSRLPDLVDHVKRYMMKQEDACRFGKDLFAEFHDDLFLWMNWWTMKESGRTDMYSADAEDLKDVKKFREVLVKYGRGLVRP